MRAGIIAAGWGRRLGEGPKALAQVGGRALIDRVLDGLAEAGVDRVACIINEAARDVPAHVARRAGGPPVEWIIRTTPTSMHSFLAVLERLAEWSSEGALITTVDAVCRPGTLAMFAEAASHLPEADLVLGVTTLVDDEKPLYAVPAELDPLALPRPGSTFVVESLSNQSKASPFVTAGFYYVSPRVLRERPFALAGGFCALRQFLGHLVVRGYRCWGVPLPPVVDVDRPEDLVMAAELVAMPAERGSS